MVYNKLMKRRNPSLVFYDVFSGSRSAQAKACFKILAQKLQKENIDSRKYLVVMSCYGKFQDNKHLPYPGFLCSDKALEIYKWLSVKEAKKYFYEAQMVKGLEQGLEVTAEEVLGRIKSDKESWDKVKVKGGEKEKRAHIPELLFSFRDGPLSSWYLALHKDFIESDLFPWVEPDKRREIKNCRLFFKYHPKVRAKAMEIING